MRDQCEKNRESHEIGQTLSTDPNINAGSRGFVRLVSATASARPGEFIITIVVIEKRVLIRECLTRCLRTFSGHAVVSFPNIDSWIEVRDDIPASLIVLCVVGKPNAPETYREISRLSSQRDPLPVILLSDEEDPAQIADAIGRGARGYITSSVSLKGVVEVLRLVRGGGICVSTSSMTAARPSNDQVAASQQNGDGPLTTRQAAVAEALRRGKPNKVIANELNMRESTVKVHVRNIMRKLKARNRTEVAVMTNELMRDDGAV
jgi:DNA-binding NarL/FixJ family response regulator